jgi:glycosyltransferase involved in cell wall biosynthesis
VPRALTVLQVLPALNTGGVERSTLEIAEALVAAGHRSIVLSAGGDRVAELERGGSTHVTLDLGKKSLRSLLQVAALRRWLAQERPDIVHVRSRLPAWLVWWAGRGLPMPRPVIVTTVHGLNSPGRYSAVLTFGQRVICVSETVRTWLLRHYPALDPARLRVIPRGIDPAAFPHGHAPAPTWREDFFATYPQLAGGALLTLPGRGTRLKGHADALRLLARLRADGCDARLLLLGVVEPGRDRYLVELDALARALGVSEAVVFSPSRRDVREVLAISDIVLQLSNKPEAFGRTVAEALSLGRPVLGWAHGGVGEILATQWPEAGLAVGDLDALVERAGEWIARAPSVPQYTGPTLAAMQQETLAVYAEVAHARD